MTEIEIKLQILQSVPKTKVEYNSNTGLIQIPKTKEELLSDINFLYKELSSECKLKGSCRKPVKE